MRPTASFTESTGREAKGTSFESKALAEQDILRRLGGGEQLDSYFRGSGVVLIFI